MVFRPLFLSINEIKSSPRLVRARSPFSDDMRSPTALVARSWKVKWGSTETVIFAIACKVATFVSADRWCQGNQHLNAWDRNEKQIKLLQLNDMRRVFVRNNVASNDLFKWIGFRKLLQNNDEASTIFMWSFYTSILQPASSFHALELWWQCYTTFPRWLFEHWHSSPPHLLPWTQEEWALQRPPRWCILSLLRSPFPVRQLRTFTFEESVFFVFCSSKDHMHWRSWRKQ